MVIMRGIMTYLRTQRLQEQSLTRSGNYKAGHAGHVVELHSLGYGQVGGGLLRVS